MPYGGNDEAKKNHYRGVYQSILAPAAIEAGYTPKRSDIEGAPGSITLDIVRDLADSDIVIADITEGNPNVFLEIGIRHVMRKSGTVHVVDKRYADAIPFDLRNYRAIEYSVNLADIPEVIKSIVAAIRLRERDPNRSDNLVHDALPSLPIDVRTIGDAELRKQIEQLQGTLEELREQKTKLETRLALVDPLGMKNDGLAGEIDIDHILDEADAIRAGTGDNALLRLHGALESGGEQGFVKELRTILRSPYLNSSDYMSISNMCDRLGLDEHGRATLEIGHALYPERVDMMLSLAHDYHRSANRNLRARGRKMVEDFLGVEHTPQGPKLAGRPPGEYISAAIAIFNEYLYESQYNWVISIADSLEEQVGSDVLFARNKARALHKLGMNREAEEAFERAVELYPHDDTLHAFYADFLDDLGRYNEAYEEYEKAICSDPNDGNRFINLANHIMLRGVYRDDTFVFAGPVAGAPQRLKLAMPLYMKGIEVSPQKRRDVVNALVRFGQVNEAQEIQEGQVPGGQYNFAPLQYVLHLMDGGV
jgi:uncharacterized protein (TIGR02996 family)